MRNHTYFQKIIKKKKSCFEKKKSCKTRLFLSKMSTRLFLFFTKINFLYKSIQDKRMVQIDRESSKTKHYVVRLILGSIEKKL